jgi:hypothetical protein
MEKYQMKYMFDWESDVCLWSTNDPTRNKYGYPVNLEQLTISEDLRATLRRLIDKHDEALNWENPAGDLLWTTEQIEAFIREAEEGYHRLCDELRDEYEITNEAFSEFSEELSHIQR